MASISARAVDSDPIGSHPVSEDDPSTRTRFRPPSRRKFLLLTVAMIGIVVAGAAIWSRAVRPVRVRVAAAEVNLPEQVFGLGTIGADVQSNVGFKVAGVLARTFAAEGERVKAGQILAQLDARDVEAQVAEARAGVQQAEAGVDKAQADVAAAQANLVNTRAMAARRQSLVRHGFASVEETQQNVTAMEVAKANLTVAQTEVGTAQAGLAAARAQQEFQEATLANYTLRAPYDAWVTARDLNPGSMPVPGQAVFALTDPTTIWVIGYVDERLAGRLKVGQSATIALRSEPGKRYPGHIARIEIQSDAVNEERLVDVAFNTLPVDIHLAEQAEVYLTTGTLPQAVPVPPSAVTGLTDSSGMVWTVEDGRLAQRHVRFGPELLDGRLPIVTGLPDDARVVLAPQPGWRAGRAATIVARDAGK